jgi:transposase-like protein
VAEPSSLKHLSDRIHRCSPFLSKGQQHYQEAGSAYIILGINEKGRKEVLSIQVGANESSKYWLSILNELKNRGVQDILLLCADGLTGIKESITVAFPNIEYQRCIVHQVRNTLKYVADKDKKEFATDLKKIYHAASEEAGVHD